MANTKTNREISLANYTPNNVTWEMVNVGSLQRIADATEKMAQRHTDLMRDLDSNKRWYEQERHEHAATIRQLRAARGVITKLRKQLAEARKPVQGNGDGR